MGKLKETKNKEKETIYEDIIERDMIGLRDGRNKDETFVGDESTTNCGSRRKVH